MILRGLMILQGLLIFQGLIPLDLLFIALDMVIAPKLRFVA